MTTNHFPSSEANTFHYIIVGGGTAGCVIASRLAEKLPSKRILMIEAGPSDLDDERILDLRNMFNLLGGDLDFNYRTEPQIMGNSNINYSRAKVLGGCSSHNSSLSFHSIEYDTQRWAKSGVEGWSFETMKRLIQKLRTNIINIDPKHRNPIYEDWIQACATVFDAPVVEDFNVLIKSEGSPSRGVGFAPVSYIPENHRRISASVAYIHPILRGEEKRPNLFVLTNAWVTRINYLGGSVTGVDVELQSGELHTLRAKTETILCAGAIDTPRLMLLSGIGPRDHLQSLKIPVVHELPGVGENLQDHPETIIVWELNKAYPKDTTAMQSDTALLLRHYPHNYFGDDGSTADLWIHTILGEFCINTERMGYVTPENVFCMVPNVARPASRGRLFLTSADRKAPPALDFGYFTDAEGYDASLVVAGLKYSRELAKQSPFKEWIKREVAPGPAIQSDEDLSEYGRKVHHTVYHACGTTKMGSESDPLAVVNSRLQVKGIKALRVADAGVLPFVTTNNPMVTILAIAERCAEMIIEEARYHQQSAML
ncbi:hypothetical protein BKA66DRAFT_612889 [Pyrenochaeta sp. MPI-SDFR-AT-0127]|nr:hypothetical protein BKA66DRAFT_612889 [Pyrenochaeta sp. MPI-SDFR-AT-0127]